ncbi:MAG: S-layer homology domain-containing protein [Syntrophomonadaceae bacterium]|jgi:hypothetical protein
MQQKDKFKPTILLMGVIMLLLLVTNLPAVGGEPGKATASSSFSDVTPQDPNLIYIQYISQLNLIKGFPDGTFHPREGLTRAQAAVVLAQAAKLYTPAVSATPFSDLPVDHWAAPYITAAARAGYIQGFPDGSFRPDEQLTRAQGITLVMSLCTQPDRAVLPALLDIDSSHWAAPALATALALEMIGRSPDGKNIYPDAIMNRGSMARALAILLTRDPGLYQTSLTGTLTEIKGHVSLIRNGKSQVVKNEVTVRENDIIETGTNGQARIIYADGSGTLIEKGTTLHVKKAAGRSYIKIDGNPGVAVDFLQLELKKGKLFTALATRQQVKEESISFSDRKLLAARDSFDIFAAQPAATNQWYHTAQQKKVKVQVDMPWGVAAIRGTFIMVNVSPDGRCSVSCLTGSAEITGSSGVTIPVGGGQSTGIANQGADPDLAAGMSEADKAEFAQTSIQAWVVDTALQMDLNQEAQPTVVIVEIPDSLTGELEERSSEPQTEDDLIETIVEVIINALQESGIELQPEIRENLLREMKGLSLPAPAIPEPQTPAPAPSDNTDPGPPPGNQARSQLSSLLISGGTLAPDFTSATTNYSVAVSYEVGSITITPTSVESMAVITVNGQEVISGSASPAIDLAVGDNTVIIKVTAADNSETNYTITITRGAPVVYGSITSIVDGSAIDELGIIKGTTDGHGQVVTGGGIYIKNNTLDRWIKPKRDPITGEYIGKSYVVNRSEACLIGPLKSEDGTDDLSAWELNLSGLGLPHGYSYSIYLQVKLGGVVKSDQAVITVNTNPLGNISSNNSTLEICNEEESGIALLRFSIEDTSGELVFDLAPDEVCVVVDGVTTSLGQAPFWMYNSNYGFCYFIGADGSHIISSFKVGGVEILNKSLEFTITGAVTINGKVKDQDNNPLKGVEVSAVVPWGGLCAAQAAGGLGIASIGHFFQYNMVNSAITDFDGAYSISLPRGLGYWFITKYDLPGYRASDQEIEIDIYDADDIIEVQMVADNTRPNHIVTDTPNLIDGMFNLIAVDDFLADDSWYDIVALIEANCVDDGSGWCDGLLCEYFPYINLDGSCMSIENNCEPVVINQDFVIPAYLVVDRAGNVAANDIIIDSNFEGWVKLGGKAASPRPASALSLFSSYYGYGISELIYKDEAQAGIAAYTAYKPGGWIEPELITETEVRETELAGGPWGIYGAFIDASGTVQLAERIDVYNEWDGKWEWDWNIIAEKTGTNARLLKLGLRLIDGVIAEPVMVFADTVSGGYVYGQFASYRDGDLHIAEPFYIGAYPIIALDQFINIYQGQYVGFSTGSTISIMRNVEPGWEEIGIFWITGLNEAAGISLALDENTDDCLVAFVEQDGEQKNLKVYRKIQGELTSIEDISPPGIIPGDVPLNLEICEGIIYLGFADSNNKLCIMQYDDCNNEWNLIGHMESAPIITPGYENLDMYVYNGIPIVAYKGEDGKAYVVKYCRKESPQ